MTKEIIIDGVNVAECGFFHENTGTECHIALAFSEDYGTCWHCEQIEDCYFKQLKRLAKENEELKKQVETFKKMFEEQFEYKEINLKKLEKIKAIANNAILILNCDCNITEKFKNISEIIEEK